VLDRTTYVGGWVGVINRGKRDQGLKVRQFKVRKRKNKKVIIYEWTRKREGCRRTMRGE